MARPWRVCFSDASYHVAARGNHRRAVSLDCAGQLDSLGD
jgi:hypothetical protein